MAAQRQYSRRSRLPTETTVLYGDWPLPWNQQPPSHLPTRRANPSFFWFFSSSFSSLVSISFTCRFLTRFHSWSRPVKSATWWAPFIPISMSDQIGSDRIGSLVVTVNGRRIASIIGCDETIIQFDFKGTKGHPSQSLPTNDALFFFQLSIIQFTTQLYSPVYFLFQ